MYEKDTDKLIKLILIKINEYRPTEVSMYVCISMYVLIYVPMYV